MRGLDLLAHAECNDEQREEADAVNALGVEALEEGFYRLAELRFLEAFELDRGNPIYELNLGRAILGNPRRPPSVRVRMARVHLELAVKRMPDNVTARYYLAQCQAESGDQLNAKRNLQAIIADKPDFYEAQRLLEQLGGAVKRKKKQSDTRRRLFGWLRQTGRVQRPG